MPKSKEDGIWFTKSLNDKLPDLSPIQRMLFAKIISADEYFDDGCTFSNKKLGDYIGLSARQVGIHISNMVGKGHLRRWIEYPHGKQTRYLQPTQNFHHPLPISSTDTLPKTSTSIYKDKKIIKEPIESDTLPDSLIKEMEKQYPNKDIELVADKVEGKFVNEPLSFKRIKFIEWCETEFEVINNSGDWLQKLGDEVNG